MLQKIDGNNFILFVLNGKNISNTASFDCGAYFDDGSNYIDDFEITTSGKTNKYGVFKANQRALFPILYQDDVNACFIKDNNATKPIEQKNYTKEFLKRISHSDVFDYDSILHIANTMQYNTSLGLYNVLPSVCFFNTHSPNFYFCYTKVNNDDTTQEATEMLDAFLDFTETYGNKPFYLTFGANENHLGPFFECNFLLSKYKPSFEGLYQAEVLASVLYQLKNTKKYNKLRSSLHILPLNTMFTATSKKKMYLYLSMFLYYLFDVVLVQKKTVFLWISDKVNPPMYKTKYYDNNSFVEDIVPQIGLGDGVGYKADHPANNIVMDTIYYLINDMPYYNAAVYNEENYIGFADNTVISEETINFAWNKYKENITTEEKISAILKLKDFNGLKDTF